MVISRRKTLFALMASPALGAALVADPVSADAANSKNKNNMIVGADTTFPPFESEVNGKVTCFDIDMIRAIAKAEGLTATIKPLPFSGIIPSLQVGSIDAAVAGITIEKSRMKNVDFSDAYYKAGLSILVKGGSNIKGFADLKGHVVATKKATSSVTYLERHGFDMSRVKQFSNIDSAYEALETGGADAVIFDNPVNVNFKAMHHNVKIVGPRLTGEYYGVAITKHRPDLVAKINAGLAAIKKDGTYKQLFDKYFGGDTSGVVSATLTPASVAVPD